MELHVNQTIEIAGTSYLVEKLLGHGKGGYSFLVTSPNGTYVLKAIHHEPCSYYAFGDKMEAERHDYERLSNAGIPIPKMLAFDKQRELILKEYVDGATLFDLVRDDVDISTLLPKIKEIAEKAKRAGLNIDYFPTNFVVDGENVVYVDYECNDYDPRWSLEAWGLQYYSKTEAFLAYLAEHSK